MPFQALRFVHAASLLVDHQLHDVGPVDEELKPSLIDATVTAFERLVEVCVDQEVDFLLLTGDTFCEADRSLRARVNLREGFECLREAGIEVFVVPGPLDPPSAWQAFSALPENVSLFVPQTDEPTAVMRDGHVVATIQACSRCGDLIPRSTEADTLQTLRTSPLRISIVNPADAPGHADKKTIEALLRSQTTDYLAVPLPCRHLTTVYGERMAHCPGPATSISQHDTGLCGCTLVTVDDDARISARHFATSPVRREQIEIDVDEDASWDELIAMMREWIDSLELLGAASVALLDWHLTGTCELLTSLEDDQAEAELFELLAADATTLADMSVSHRLQISAMTDAQAEAAWRDHAQHEARGEKANPFISGLFSRLDEATAIAQDVVETARSKTDPDSPWLRHLEEIVSRVDQKAIAAHARRHGTAWFQTIDTQAESDWEAGEDAEWSEESAETETTTKALAETQLEAAPEVDTQTTSPIAAAEVAAEDKDGFDEEYEDDYDEEEFDDEYEAA